MFEACLPFGPVVTEGNALVFLQRLEAIRLNSREVSEQIFAAFVGVMKPKPFASLNHLTVPVAITDS
jgi:hypothetical protein